MGAVLFIPPCFTVLGKTVGVRTVVLLEFFDASYNPVTKPMILIRIPAENKALPRAINGMK